MEEEEYWLKLKVKGMTVRLYSIDNLDKLRLTPTIIMNELF